MCVEFHFSFSRRDNRGVQAGLPDAAEKVLGGLAGEKIYTPFLQRWTIKSIRPAFNVFFLSFRDSERGQMVQLWKDA